MPDFNSYQKYKAAGIPWLEEIPAHWATPSLGQVSNLSKGSGGNKEDEKASGIPCVRYGDLYTTHKYFIEHTRSFIADEAATNYTRIRCGDVLFAASGETLEEIGKSAVNLISGTAYCGGDVILFQRSQELLPKYAGYMLDSPPITHQKAIMGRGFTVYHIYGKHLRYLRIPIPPVEEQTAIVRFLDHTDEQIQRYIAGKERLIALLHEQRQALVHQAVTRGLDPNVRLKPSGVEWLGDVPEHWSIRTLGQIAGSFRTGPFGSMLHQSDYIEGGTPVINPIHIRGGVIVEDPNCSVSETVADRLSGYRLAQHDLIFSRRGDLGRCALVQDRESTWICGTGSIRVRIKYDDIEPKFLIQALQAPGVGEHLSLVSVGATMNNLNTGILKSVPILVPPLQEQGELLEYIGRQSRGATVSITRAHQQIELIEEYRTRLIADVVTGQLDVREAAAQLQEAP